VNVPRIERDTLMTNPLVLVCVTALKYEYRTGVPRSFSDTSSDIVRRQAQVDWELLELPAKA
jgi:hypothetical protein